SATDESGGGIGSMLGGIFGGGNPLGNSSRSNRQGIGEAFAKSAMRSIGSAVGREIIRGVLGSIFKR
ncbi:MAG: helicase HerA-like domain-containing protein, partial [Gallionella sp.]